jgi:hypothetical protein
MSDSLSVRGVGPMDRDRSHALSGQTMAYAAVTAGFFALGSYLGRTLSEGWAIVWFIVAFACLSFWALVALILFGIVLILCASRTPR